jgi:hypothetical protein
MQVHPFAAVVHPPSFHKVSIVDFESCGSADLLRSRFSAEARDILRVVYGTRCLLLGEELGMKLRCKV